MDDHHVPETDTVLLSSVSDYESSSEYSSDSSSSFSMAYDEAQVILKDIKKKINKSDTLSTIETILKSDHYLSDKKVSMFLDEYGDKICRFAFQLRNAQIFVETYKYTSRYTTFVKRTMINCVVNVNIDEPGPDRDFFAELVTLKCDYIKRLNFNGLMTILEDCSLDGFKWCLETQLFDKISYKTIIIHLFNEYDEYTDDVKTEVRQTLKEKFAHIGLACSLKESQYATSNSSGRTLLYILCYHGYCLDTIKFFYEICPDFDFSTVEDSIKYLQTPFWRCDTDVCDFLIVKGADPSQLKYTDMLQGWSLKNAHEVKFEWLINKQGIRYEFFYYACKYEHLKLVRMLSRHLTPLQMRTPPPLDTLEGTQIDGTYDIMNIIFVPGKYPPPSIELVKYLVEQLHFELCAKYLEDVKYNDELFAYVADNCNFYALTHTITINDLESIWYLLFVKRVPRYVFDCDDLLRIMPARHDSKIEKLINYWVNPIFVMCPEELRQILIWTVCSHQSFPLRTRQKIFTLVVIAKSHTQPLWRAKAIFKTFPAHLLCYIFDWVSCAP